MDGCVCTLRGSCEIYNSLLWPQVETLKKNNPSYSEQSEALCSQELSLHMLILFLESFPKTDMNIQHCIMIYKAENVESFSALGETEVLLFSLFPHDLGLN